MMQHDDDDDDEMRAIVEHNKIENAMVFDVDRVDQLTRIAKILRFIYIKLSRSSVVDGDDDDDDAQQKLCVVRDIRKRIMYALMTSSKRKLFTPINGVYGKSDGGSGGKEVSVHIAGLLFIILSQCQRHMVVPGSRARFMYENTKPLHIDYVMKNRLSTHPNKPVKFYTLKELVDSYKQLVFAFNTLDYNDELFSYAELLELRCLELMRTRGDERTYSLKRYREKCGGGGGGGAAVVVVMYEPNKEFMRHFSVLLHGVRARFSSRSIFERTCYDNTYDCDMGDDEERVYSWLLDHAKNSSVDSTLSKYKRMYLRAELRIGEMEQSRVDYPEDIHTEYKVLKRYRGNSHERIWDTSNYDLAAACEHCLKPYVNKTRAGNRIHIAGKIAAYLIVRTHMQTSYYLDFDRYVVWQCDISRRHEEFQMERHPFIVQTFNHFDCFYKDTVYECRSILRALMIWCKIVIDDFECTLNGQSLEPFLRDITTRDLPLKRGEKRRIENPNRQERILYNRNTTKLII